MKNFILIGAAGYIAPRHIKAISETKNNLIAVCDVSDSVGILDSYFKDAELLSTENQLKHFIKKNQGEIDYISICTPNFLHMDFIRLALTHKIDVICEKPLVLNLDDLDEIESLERKYNSKVWTILQLRLHQSIKKFKTSFEKNDTKNIRVNLKYITARGNWYDKSWKGDTKKSGGISFNIGIHLFDMLNYVFGEYISLKILRKNAKTIEGELTFQKASVHWFLSIDFSELPKDAVIGEKSTFRSITFGDTEIEFSQGFTDLHTISYTEILAGRGFRAKDAKVSIEIAEDINKVQDIK